MKQQDENLIELNLFGRPWLLDVNRAILIDPLYAQNKHTLDVDTHGVICFDYPAWNDPDEGVAQIRVVTHTDSDDEGEK